MTHGMLLTPRSPSQTSLRELGTPGEPTEAIIMVLVCIQMGKQGPREWVHLADSHTATLTAEPEPCLPPWLVIWVPFSPFITPPF